MDEYTFQAKINFKVTQLFESQDYHRSKSQGNVVIPKICVSNVSYSTLEKILKSKNIIIEKEKSEQVVGYNIGSIKRLSTYPINQQIDKNSHPVCHIQSYHLRGPVIEIVLENFAIDEPGRVRNIFERGIAADITYTGKADPHVIYAHVRQILDEKYLKKSTNAKEVA